MGIALALLLAAAPAAEDRVETSVSLGVGFGYELAGANFAVRYRHVEGFVGLGFVSLLGGAAFGGRYFLRDDGSGPFASLNLSVHRHIGGFFDEDGGASEVFLLGTITLGYRWTWDSFFVQAAVGGGAVYEREIWKTPPSPTTWLSGTPDLILALGWRF
jgi:hypothetical protein